MDTIDIIDKINEFGIKIPQNICHIYNENVMTYGDLLKKSDALASYLLEIYGEDKTPIIVYGSKENEMIIAFIACVKAGHAYIPVDSSFPYERVKNIIEDSETKLVLNVGMNEYLFEGCDIKDLSSINNIIDVYMDKSPKRECKVKKDDVYYIIYTSGSTGKPKGVQITLGCLESFVKWAKTLCKGKENDTVFMNQAPFSFDLSVMDLYLSLSSGSTLYSLDKNLIGNMKKLFQAFKSSNIGVWVSTPSFADICLADSSFCQDLLPKLEIFLFCGETLTNRCSEKLLSRFKKADIINMYGPTEATVAITALKVTNEICKTMSPLPVGKVKEDCKIMIVDKFGKEKLEGERGEILIWGESVSLGYYKNEEKTKKSFGNMEIDKSTKRYFKTGDEGYIKDGMLYYSGRIDFQIKLNGFRIELEDIENNLTKLSIIKSATVVPFLEEGKVKYLLGFVVLNENLGMSEFSTVIHIKKHLKKLLPEYMIPRKIIIKQTLPMTTNGKVDRKVLMEEIK